MQRDSLLLTEMIDAFRSHITQSEGAVWAHSTLTTRITPSMNCGQRGQIRHDLCAYLPVRGGHGRSLSSGPSPAGGRPSTWLGGLWPVAQLSFTGRAPR